MFTVFSLSSAPHLFILLSLLLSHSSPPIFPHTWTNTHKRHVKASASPECLVLDVHTVVSQSDDAEGKQRVWVRLRGARADATSETQTDLLMNGKYCDDPCLETKE